MPYPENLDHHFVVDPTKFDYYAMDCYRMLADDSMAENLANEVIRASTDFDGQERAPMRVAEARVTLVWWQPEAETWPRRSSRESAHSAATANPCRRC
jgi:hypothetical protein